MCMCVWQNVFYYNLKIYKCNLNVFIFLTIVLAKVLAKSVFIAYGTAVCAS